MTFCTLFEPFYLKYQVTEEHRLELLHRFVNHIEQRTVIPQQPNGWTCEVETSFGYGDVSDELNIDEILQPYIHEAFGEIGFPIKPYSLSSWYNIYGKNHYQEAHNHLPSQLSGVYFLSYDRDIHGGFYFVNPMADLMKLAYNKVNEVSLFREQEEPIVFPGTLILFPSFMQHKVHRPCLEDHPKMADYSDEDYPKRVTISFNIDISDW